MAWLIPRMEELLREAGFTPSIKAYPPERSLMMVRSGSVAGEFMRTEEALSQAPELVKVDVPLFRQNIVAVSLREDIKITSKGDLVSQRVGFVKTNRYIRDLAESLPQRVDAPHQDSLFRMLKEGRFDVAIVIGEIAERKKREEEFSGLRIHSPVLAQEPVFFVLHLSQAALAPRIKAAFEKKLASGWSLVPTP